MTDDLLARFDSVKPAGDGWIARCPAHEDRRASLSIGRGDDGRWLLKCHAGCAVDAILPALNLEPRDLFPDTGTPSGRREVAVYDYGTFEVVRYDPKDFRQRRPDGHGGHIWNIKGIAPRLYHHDDLTGHEAVIVAEGEKDVDRLWALGLSATCNAGGAGKWKATHTEQLVAAGVQRVVVLPDADEAGRAHGQAVARACHAAGLTVQIAALPDGTKDVSAYLDTGHDTDALIELVRAATAYTPSAEPLPPGWCVLSDIEATSDEGPPLIARGLAWQGRVTILHSREKVGKSTYVSAGVAAVTQGTPFLDRPTRQGPVLWFGEEAPGDIRQRLNQWGAECHRITFGNRLGRTPTDPDSLPSLVTRVRPVLVIMDTLTTFVAAMGIRDVHGAGDLGAALASLVLLARDSDAAIVILHHNRKNPSSAAETGDKFGEYRDSTAIGAAADMIVSLSPEPPGIRTRRLTLKGRWFEPTLVVTLGPEGYTLEPDITGDDDSASAPPAARPLDERVLLHLLRCNPQARPPARTIAQALDCSGRRYQALREAVDALVDRGLVNHDQRQGTTQKRQQGYALTEQGRAHAFGIRARCVSSVSSVSTNGKQGGNALTESGNAPEPEDAFTVYAFPQGGVAETETVNATLSEDEADALETDGDNHDGRF